MDEQDTLDKATQGLKDQIKEYEKLKRVGSSKEIQDFFDFQLKTVADKMIWAFTTGKNGDNIQNWDDFCKVRGEIVARLHPIQEVMGAEAMVTYLKEQLDSFYSKQVL